MITDTPPTLSTSTKEPKLAWFSVASEFNSTDEQKASILAAADSIEWLDISTSRTFPMSQGMCIEKAIQQLALPEVSHAGYSAELAPFSLIAIRSRFSNGLVEMFVLDRGSEASPVVSKFYENDES